MNYAPAVSDTCGAQQQQTKSYAPLLVRSILQEFLVSNLFLSDIEISELKARNS
jgi:hypothetical protein